MSTDNEHEEKWMHEAKHEAEVQGEWLFEQIKDRANEYSLDLDWYAKEVIKQIKRYVKEELGE